MDTRESENSEYLQSIIYYPIEYEEDFPVYHFEYTQRTFTKKRLHFHNGFEIGVCLEGSGVFLVANRVYRFEKGSVSFISSDQPHIANSPNEQPSHWEYLTFDWEKLFGEKELSVSDNIFQDESFAALIRIIYDECERRQPGCRDVVNHLMNALICKLIQRESGTETVAAPSAKIISERIYAAEQYILNNYSQKISVMDFAAANNYSVNYFRKLFKEQVGVSPLDYINNVRLKMASIMLRTTDKSILEISVSCGFETLSSFNRNFKKKYGMVPSKWRQSWR